jgi:hypothetical protein
MSSALAEISDLFNEDVACSLADARPEIQSRLHKLPDSLWRSLGQYLDSGWADRERFVQLDIKITALKIQQDRIYARSRQSRIVSIDCKLADACNT